jgi:hypothetical protein
VEEAGRSDRRFVPVTPVTRFEGCSGEAPAPPPSLSVLMSTRLCSRTRRRTHSRSLTMQSTAVQQRFHLCRARCFAWCCALRAARFLCRALGPADAGAGPAPCERIAAEPTAEALPCGCGCCEKKPRRRAVASAFLSVERSCNSLNSFCAANVDASSTDHAAAGDRRRANDAIVLAKSFFWLLGFTDSQLSHGSRVSRLSRGCLAAVSRMLFHEFRGCLAAVSRLSRS